MKRARHLFLSILISSSSLTEAQEFESASRQSVLADSPWVTPRGSGLSRALGPVANGAEAPFFNPAGIGGLHEKESRPSLTRFHLIDFSFSANEQTQGIISTIINEQKIGDDLEEQLMTDAFSDQAKYARVSYTPHIQYQRFYFGMTVDYQVAAVKTTENGDVIDFAKRNQVGPMVGFSFSAFDDSLNLGLAAAYLSRKQTRTYLSRTEFEDSEVKKEILGNARHESQGLPLHTGLRWQMTKAWRTALSLTATDIGNTKYRSKEPGDPSIHVKENVGLGVSASPLLSSWATLNLILGLERLTYEESHFLDKLHSGFELTFGQRFGSEARLSLLGGYSSLGLSYGAGLNLGLVVLRVSSHPEDIGINDHRVIERRINANFAVNIAAF